MVRVSKKTALLGILLFLTIVPKTFAQDNPPVEVLPLAQPTTTGTGFLPNSIIVGYKKDKDPLTINSAVSIRATRGKALTGRFQNLLQDMTTKAAGGEPPELILGRFNSLNKRFGIADASPLLKTSSGVTFFSLSSPTQIGVMAAMGAYRADPAVAFSQPNFIYQVKAIPNDTYYQYQWNLPKIEMEKGWDKTEGSNSVVVAVVDTGIDNTHPDFSGREIQMGYDFSTCNRCDFYGNCIEEKPQDDNPYDDNGHGTHVAGIIAAATNNNNGIAGINWNIKLLAVKALGIDGCGSTSDIVSGINYATTNGAKVINLSLGGTYDPAEQALPEAITNAVNNGTTVVASAGNENQDAANVIPARYPNVIAVAATGQNDEKAFYSNYGNVVALAAPGGNPANDCTTSPPFDCILSLCPGGYCVAAGTSMAAPHVSGVAALLLAQNPSLSPSEIKSRLTSTTDSIADSRLGSGRLNAYKALSLGTSPTQTVTPSPTGTISNTPTPTSNLSPTPSLTLSPSPTGQPSATPTPTGQVSPTTTPSPTPPVLCNLKPQGDANCDGKVDLLDFEFWRAEYLGERQTEEADFNKDGNVNLLDFEVWKMNAHS